MRTNLPYDMGPRPIRHLRHLLWFMAGLSLAQVDILWSAVVNDKLCSDEALEWFVQQAQSKDLHALSHEVLKYIFTEKVSYLHV